MVIFTPERCCVPALPSPTNGHCLAFCSSYLLTIYALRLFKVLIVLSSVLALFSLFIQVVDEHGERSQELRQAKEKGSGKPTAIVNGIGSN